MSARADRSGERSRVSRRSEPGSCDRFLSVVDGAADIEAARMLAWPGIWGWNVTEEEWPLAEAVSGVYAALTDTRPVNGADIAQLDVNHLVEAAYALGLAMGRRLGGARLSVKSVAGR
jgi:hypothetical protein